MNENREQLTENKIIILYVLKETGLPVSALQITDILAGKMFMDYFTQQETLSQLLGSGMIKEHEDENNRKYYVITEEGISAVNTLHTIIPVPLKQNFDIHKEEIKKMVKRDWEVNATWHIDENDSHYVRCFVRDGDSFLIDLKILAGNKKIASEMCINWRKNTEKIYSEIIGQLLGHSDS